LTDDWFFAESASKRALPFLLRLCFPIAQILGGSQGPAKQTLNLNTWNLTEQAKATNNFARHWALSNCLEINLCSFLR
jgi:hypothetical protein